MKIVCIIPARYQSKRFPGKPLALIGMHPMIEWVYRRAIQAEAVSEVLVATDDRRIYDTVLSFGGQAVMTPGTLTSGSDRVAQVARNLSADVVVNIQGDEPLITPDLLQALCAVFELEGVEMATPIKRILTVSELTDPNVVRVVVDKEKNALFFSRSTIPYLRDHHEQSDWHNHFTFYKHIGVYAYRRDFLIKLSQWPGGILEQAEHLEQLRVLENGYRIKTVETDYEGISVDTPEDLKSVNAYIQKNKIKLGSIDEEM
jgi:3-deoxy-manno-octulosonate cytidylyltransferase (CMP-KDO synthetase)